jgi:phospholipid/cholesterol/gamma-HCH transport system substrate-binding protein
MASPVNRFKIGLFVVIGLLALLLTTIGVGVHFAGTKAVEYRTYFAESVQGLDVGGSVKFRGVTIGRVSGIRIAADRLHIEVVEELSVEELQRLGLVESGTGKGRPRPVPNNLRARVASVGITGSKFVAIDYLDPVKHPPPFLSFEPPPNYIPAAESVLQGLEDAVVSVADKLPALTDSIVSTIARVDRMLAQLEKDEVSAMMAASLKHADQVLGNLDHTIRRIDAAGLPERSRHTLDELQQAVVKVNAVLDHVDGDGGLVASASRAADAIGDLGRGSRGTARELESTMRTIQEAADRVRVLAETLERDPDMLVKGRAKAKAH